MLRRWIVGGLTGCLLAACQLTAPVTPKARASVRPAAPLSAKLSPSPLPSAPAPRGAPSVPLIASFAPPKNSQLLEGLVTIDAAYVLSNNSGNVLAKLGGNVLAVGSGLISDKGSSVISDNGGSLVANNSGNFRLLQDAGAAPLGVGTVLPASGMEVTVRDLRDGRRVSVGQDAQNRPLYTIFSDAQGRYAAHIPDALTGNVLVVARVPNSTDPRLVYPLMTSAVGAAARPIDEDVAVVTQYARKSFAARMRLILSGPDVASTMDYVATEWKVPALFREQTLGLITEFRAAGLESGATSASEADLDALCLRVSDTVFAPVDLPALVLDKALVTYWEGPAEPAIRALVEVVKRLRERAGVVMAQEPDHFANAIYVKEANALRPAASPLIIRRPSDVGDFIQQAYFANNAQDTLLKVREVMIDLNMQLDPVTGHDQGIRLHTAATSVLARIGQALALNEGDARTRALALIRGFKPGPVDPDTP